MTEFEIKEVLLLTAWKRVITSIRTAISKARVRIFTASGEVAKKQIKVWYGEVTAASGVFTVNYSSAGFTTILDIDLKPIQPDTTANNQVFPCINSYTLTSVTGRLTTGNTVVLGGTALKAAGNLKVMAMITGL